MNNSYGFKPKSGNQQEDNDAGESKYQTGLDLSKSDSKKDRISMSQAISPMNQGG